MDKNFSITIGSGLSWVLAYLFMAIACGIVDHLIWRNFSGSLAVYLDLLTTCIGTAYFLYLLHTQTNCRVSLRASRRELVIAFMIMLLLFSVTEWLIDPFLAEHFPQSETDYQNMVDQLMRMPFISFFQTVVFAPVVEELLIRGFLLQGLQTEYGSVVALGLSTLVFAGLHFNFVQSLSAVLVGLVLGIVYLQTKSLAPCILIHSGYNFLSFFLLLMKASV